MATKNSTRVGQDFFLWAALTCSFIALIGFGRTYYLKALFETPPLPTLLHLHGAIMSSWCLLFGAQTYLVTTHRVHLHRHLGIFGAVLAISVVVVGAYATVEATAREVRDHVVHQFHFLFGLNLVNLLIFAILVCNGACITGSPGLSQATHVAGNSDHARTRDSENRAPIHSRRHSAISGIRFLHSGLRRG
jgi:hypothetical protein